MFNPNQAFLLVQKLKSAPRALRYYKLEKIFSICPMLLIHAELSGLVLAPRLEKRITIEIGRIMYLFNEILESWFCEK
jgi:hypothetical protein